MIFIFLNDFILSTKVDIYFSGDELLVYFGIYKFYNLWKYYIYTPSTC